MRLLALQVEGFGGLVERRFDFDPRVSVVVGPNEAGKSTLAAAVLAALYGLPRGAKDRYRPWNGSRYALALAYELDDGRRFEVFREFERDSKGVRIVDAHGGDASAEGSVGRTVIPGFAHLGFDIDVFTNGAYAIQGALGIDGSRAQKVGEALARALDGGPREDAALGALERLDAALERYVGRPRATVRAPLRELRCELDEARAVAAGAHAERDALVE
ncbi:MAG: AAA family ATPase, partial [Vulcanimicrobiaceae bacterium]